MPWSLARLASQVDQIKQAAWHELGRLMAQIRQIMTQDMLGHLELFSSSSVTDCGGRGWQGGTAHDLVPS
jgi:hypothetical protein